MIRVIKLIKYTIEKMEEIIILPSSYYTYDIYKDSKFIIILWSYYYYYYLFLYVTNIF